MTWGETKGVFSRTSDDVVAEWVLATGAGET